MIRADEAPPYSVDVSKKETIETELTIHEQTMLYSLDAEIEDVASIHAFGEMFEVYISRSVHENVVAAIKRVWESGGWVVGIFEVIDQTTQLPVRARSGLPDDHVFRLVFARHHRRSLPPTQNIVIAALEKRQAEEFDLPDQETIDRISVTGTARTTTPLLIRMPTRTRPEQALEVLQKYREMASGAPMIEVVIDEDDASMNDTMVLQRLANLDCTVTIGKHRTKIEACNGGRINDWEVLVLASDDMVPVAHGYDQKILAAMKRHFPLSDGALCFSDGYNSVHVRPGEPVTCTIPILGRNVYEEFLDQHVYFPGYRSIYCDTDQTFFLTAMRRMVFVDNMIIEHRHPAAGKSRFDELYQFNARHDDHDRRLFEERKARGFDAPKIMLSILICSIPTRRKQFERLVSYLRWQIGMNSARVEICADLDDKCTVGEKRQRLLARAVGTYVAFVDDDDWVVHDYVKRILTACEEGKDCCSLVGLITENGQDPRRFEHSMKHDGWYTREDGVFIRTANHLNPVKRELALRAGFVSKNVGEDHAYANALAPLLKSEAPTGETPLYLYWFVKDRSVQAMADR